MLSYLLMELSCTTPVIILTGMLCYFVMRIFKCTVKGVHILTVTLFSAILILIFDITGLPSFYDMRWGDAGINLVPFVDFPEGMFQYGMNVLLFLPVGFFLPLLWQKFKSLLRTLLTGLSLSLAIELLQLFTFRAVDIDDLMMNTLGAAAGYLIWGMLQKIFPVFLSHFCSGNCRFWEKHGWLVCIAGCLLLNYFIIPLQYGFVYNLLWA
ncbi:VanZ family protein [Lawsonibacter sp. OA9]|uniref:VanZ family protein n=1 Tax=Oscillospiraceae TaxID=216572 RepID=UPI001F06B68F|nr:MULTISPECIES: VanZ family protein [Oscillospiraceae]MCH1980906.1 VanZ family protein [Lawsonibacter sp. OA9]MCH1981503.1 VanZ family protein [Ruminococcus sp. OA3]